MKGKGKAKGKCTHSDDAPSDDSDNKDSGTMRTPFRCLKELKEYLRCQGCSEDDGMPIYCVVKKATEHSPGEHKHKEHKELTLWAKYMVSTVHDEPRIKDLPINLVTWVSQQVQRAEYQSI